MFETIDIILLLLIRLDDSALITTFGPLKFHSLLHSETRRADYRLGRTRASVFSSSTCELVEFLNEGMPTIETRSSAGSLNTLSSSSRS